MVSCVLLSLSLRVVLVCYVGNSTEVDFSNYKYVGFNIPCPKRVVFCGINSTRL